MIGAFLFVVGLVLTLASFDAPGGGPMNRWVERIFWRLHLLERPEGVAWLEAQVRAGARERDLGPHRKDALPVSR